MLALVLALVSAFLAPVDSLAKPPSLGETYKLDNYSIPGQTNNLTSSGLVKRTVLPNGLVILVQESNYEDIVAIEVLARCGLSQEGSNLQGYTNLVLQILEERIAADADGSDAVEITGSVVQSEATPDYARLSLVTTSTYSSQLIKRLCSALTKREFSSQEVEKQKKRVLDVIDNSGGAFAQLYEIFLANFYRYHPYKRTNKGVAAVIRRATAEDVSAFYQHCFVADRMVVSVSGKVMPTTIVSNLTKQLSSLVPVQENLVEVQWEPQAVEREVYLSASSSVAWVVLGYPAPEMLSVDYAPMQVVYGALGDGLSSRLWTELREKRGLAYELGATYPDLIGPSHLLCYIVTRPTSVGEARRRIIAEVRNMRENGVTQKELEETKRKLLGNYLLRRETNTGRALSVACAELSGAGFEADNRFVRDLQAVSTQDVQRVANKYLTEATLIVARPGGRLYFDW